MASLRKAILVSFERRRSTIPTGVPFALTADFLNDPQKMQQWRAFVSRLSLGAPAPSLEAVGAVLRAFLLPCIDQTDKPNLGWTPGGKWGGTT